MAVTELIERIEVTEVLDAPGHDLVVTPHPLTDHGRVVVRGVMLAHGDTLATLLRRHGVDADEPGWVVRVGGAQVPAALWAGTRAKPGMLIEAYRVPGKSVLRLVAIVALAYFTLGTGLAAGGLGGWAGLTGFAAYAVNVGAFMLGSMVINKLLPPSPRSSYAGGAERGSTYSLQGARNQARHFEPLGLLMGQVRVAPDFAAQPYSWFAGDDQYQYVQLHAGLNVQTVDEIKIGQTDIGAFSDVQIMRAGFPAGNSGLVQWENVDTIAGGVLDAPTAPGAYVERTSSPNTVMLQVDLVARLHALDSAGNPRRHEAQIDIEYRALPSGTWQPFESGSSTSVEVLVSYTTKPLRRTLTRFLPAGQYAVRMRKLTANETATSAANDIEWAALKSYQADSAPAIARQVVGITIKASGQLNGVLDQVTWLATSKPCPVWNGSAWVTQTTSNPGALFLQFARGEFAPDGRLLWGIGKPDDQIDIEGLKAFMVHCTAQGYRFDHWWDSAVARGDVLDAIAAAGLAAKSYHTGKLGVVYMAAGQPIEAVIGMGNIKRGTMRVDYATRVTAEEIEVSSPDRNNAWLPATLRVLAPGVSVPRETARLSPPGITTEAGRLLAARLAMAQNIYGRKSVSWEMDLEHLTFRRWSLVALSHDLTQWGHSGRLHAAVSAAGTVTLELDAAVPGGAAAHVGLRLPGEQTYRVFAVAGFTGDSHTLTLAEPWPAGVPLPGNSATNPAMDTLWIYDFGAQPGLRLRVVEIKPTANLAGARITAVPEPDAFWTYLASGAYTVPAVAASVAPVALSNLRVTQQRLTLSYDLTVELDITFDATGPYDHAQVWGAVGGDALQLLGTTRTTRWGGWRAINPGTVRVEVRAFDALGRPGPVLSGTHTVTLDSPLRLTGNLLPVEELTLGLSVGTSAAAYLAGHWRINRAATAPVGPVNSIVMDLGPDGQHSVLWRAVSGTGGDSQGGWSYGLREGAPWPWGGGQGGPIDPTKAYRYAAWVRCTGDTSGVVFHGCSNVRTLAGVDDDNAYFFSRSRNALIAGRWYLVAGYVLPAGYAGPVTTRSGIWDSQTGEKVYDGQDFKWRPGAASCVWRSYQYYTSAAGAVQDWAPPMVHLVDGTEPSIAALLAMSARGRVAWMTASSQVIAVSKAGVASPASITLTALSQNLTGAPTFTVTAGTATLAGSGTTRSLAYASMATDSVTVTMSWDGITDTITIVKVREGTDGANGTNGANGAPGAPGVNAVTGVLSNEAHTVPTAADGSGGVFTGAGGTFLVFDGTTDRTGAASVAYSVLSASGVSISIAASGTYTVTGMSADSATATLRAVYAGVVIDKVYSIAKSRAGNAGAPGAPGAAAKALFITATSQVFAIAKTGAVSPASITLAATGSNLLGSPTISVIAGSATLGGSGGTRTLAPADMTTDTVTVQVSQDGLTDTVTIMSADSATATLRAVYAGVVIDKVYSIAKSRAGTAGAPGAPGAPGMPAVSSSLSRLVANFNADSLGVIDAGQTFDTTMQVRLGLDDDTGNWAVSRSTSHPSITTTLSGATVTITGIGTSVDSGTVSVSASRFGYPTQTIVVQVGKIKRATPSAYPSAFGADLFADSYSAAAATIQVQLLPDGTIEHRINFGSWTFAGNWFTPTTAGIGSSYRVFSSATTQTDTSSTTSVNSASDPPMSLASGVIYTLQASTGPAAFQTKTQTRVVNICSTSNLAPLASGTLRKICYADRT